jgi:hypothetical protein
VQSSAGSVPTLLRMTSYTPTKSKLFLVDSPPTAIFDPALCRYHTIRVRNLVSIFLSFGRSKYLSKSVALCNILQNADFLFCGISTTNLEGHLSSALRDCSLYIFSYPEDCLTLSLFIGTITNITKNVKRLLSTFGHVSTVSTVSTCSVLLSVHVQCYCQYSQYCLYMFSVTVSTVSTLCTCSVLLSVS